MQPGRRRHAGDEAAQRASRAGGRCAVAETKRDAEQRRVASHRRGEHLTEQHERDRIGGARSGGEEKQRRVAGKEGY